MNPITILSTAANAVLPIVLLIALGFFLKRKNIINDAFVQYGNKLVFNVALPVLLFNNIYKINSLGDIRWDIVIYAVSMTLVLFGIGAVAAVAVTKDRKRRGVVMQCLFRSNYSIIGLPLAATLGGTAGTAQAETLAAVIALFIIPLFNVLAVIALSVFMGDGAGKKPSFKKILLDIVKNPQIIGALMGLMALVIRSFIPVNSEGALVFSLSGSLPFLHKTIGNVAGITTPVALICMGGKFEFKAVKGMSKEITVATLSRVVLAPAIGIPGAVLLTNLGLLRCGPMEYPALIALFGSPVAVASVVMAGGMDNDDQLAAQLVVWTSVLSIFTIFLTVCLMLPAGLLTV